MRYVNSLSKLIIIFVATFVVSFGIAHADTSFTFDVIEGQGGANNEFYHGRCVRADVILDTDGNAANGDKEFVKNVIKFMKENRDYFWILLLPSLFINKKILTMIKNIRRKLR